MEEALRDQPDRFNVSPDEAADYEGLRARASEAIGTAQPEAAPTESSGVTDELQARREHRRRFGLGRLRPHSSRRTRRGTSLSVVPEAPPVIESPERERVAELVGPSRLVEAAAQAKFAWLDHKVNTVNEERLRISTPEEDPRLVSKPYSLGLRESSGQLIRLERDVTNRDEIDYVRVEAIGTEPHAPKVLLQLERRTVVVDRQPAFVFDSLDGDALPEDLTRIAERIVAVEGVGEWRPTIEPPAPR